MWSEGDPIVTTLIVLLNCCIQGIWCWPEGTYGLPMPKKGCPQTTNFDWLKVNKDEFNSDTTLDNKILLKWSTDSCCLCDIDAGSRTQATEVGSHAVSDNHLAGIDATKSQVSEKIVQNFCMKTSYIGDGDYKWEPGRYCIYKKISCPPDFREGHVYWDDNVPYFGQSDIQSKSGSLPDGTYVKNTDIFFCCRNDGSYSQPITLPTISDFYLLQLGPACQKVSGMTASEEWVYWAGENLFNSDDEGGLHPRLTRSKYPNKYTKLYYCYYTPKPAGYTLQMALYVVYAIAAIVAFVVISFAVMCIIQQCTSSKSSEIPHNAENTEPILQYTVKASRPPSMEVNRDYCSPLALKNGSGGGNGVEYNPYVGRDRNSSSSEFHQFRPLSREFKNAGIGDFNDCLRPGARGSLADDDMLMPPGVGGDGDIIVPSAPPITPDENNRIPSPPSYEDVVVQRNTESNSMAALREQI